LPVQQSTKVEFVIDLQTVRALSKKLPLFPSHALHGMASFHAICCSLSFFVTPIRVPAN
jgi:hypothetical protein